MNAESSWGNLNAVKIRPNLTALSVQTCSDGLFASVTVSSPDVEQSDETAALLRDAVAKVRAASQD